MNPTLPAGLWSQVQCVTHGQCFYLVKENVDHMGISVPETLSALCQGILPIQVEIENGLKFDSVLRKE